MVLTLGRHMRSISLQIGKKKEEEKNTTPGALLKPTTPSLYESGGPLVFEAWTADTELTGQVIKAIHPSSDIRGKQDIYQDSRNCEDSETTSKLVGMTISLL